MLDQREWVQTGSNSDRYENFFRKTRNLSRSTTDVTKNKKNVFGKESLEYGQKYLQEHGFSFISVSCKQLENFHFSSGMNSHWSHVITR